MSRTTWSLTEAAAARLEDVAERKDTESVTQFIERVADELEVGEDDTVTDRDGPEDVLTERHIDDIAVRTARATADEVETRFR